MRQAIGPKVLLPSDHASRVAKRAVAVFAALGAASGTTACIVVTYGPRWQLGPVSWLNLNPISVMPGLVFGLIIGFLLYRRRLARPWRYAAYVAASTVAYLGAYTLATAVLADALNSAALAGMIAGLFGAALLTGATVLLFPFTRKTVPCVLMLASGCGFGALLEITLAKDAILNAVLLFAPWQAGYAASLATALPHDRRMATGKQ